MEVEVSDGTVKLVESALSLPFAGWNWCGDKYGDLDHIGNDSVDGTALEFVDPTCVLVAVSEKRHEQTHFMSK